MASQRPQSRQASASLRGVGTGLGFPAVTFTQAREARDTPHLGGDLGLQEGLPLLSTHL